MVVVVGKIWKIMLERGYGFIVTEPPRDDVFFHASSLRNVRMAELREGDHVQFTMTSFKGRYRAVDVRKLDDKGECDADHLGDA